MRRIKAAAGTPSESINPEWSKIRSGRFPHKQLRFDSHCHGPSPKPYNRKPDFSPGLEAGSRGDWVTAVFRLTNLCSAAS